MVGRLAVGLVGFVLLTIVTVANWDLDSEGPGGPRG